MKLRNKLPRAKAPLLETSLVVGLFGVAISLTLPACSSADESAASSSEDSLENAQEDASDDTVPASEGPTRAPRVPGTDPYAGVVGLKGAALKTALFDLIKNHRSISYDRARDTIFNENGFIAADRTVECVYTGRVVNVNGSSAPGGFNTEHSWPQSLGAQSGPAKSDLHHLFPADARANSSRGNHPFDFVTCLEGDAGTCSFSVGGSALGKNENGRTAFEVREKSRGDIARAHFYFSIRYNKRIGPDEELALRKWNDEDPVDDAERARNDAIEKIQLNRDPFVDHPEFAAAVDDF